MPIDDVAVRHRTHLPYPIEYMRDHPAIAVATLIACATVLVLILCKKRFLRGRSR